MHLVQIILPLYANDGTAIAAAQFRAVRDELVDRFGGVTAFTRAPAEGLWENNGSVQRDDVLLYEVMADSLDTSWWADYRQSLQARFRQQEVVIRAHAIERL